MRSAYGLVGLSFVAALAPAAAQDSTVSAEDLIKNADHYLNRQISFRGAYCYAAKLGYECRTDAPLRIATDKMPDGAAKAVIDSQCRRINDFEFSSACGFTLRMVPTKTTTMEGDYIQNGRRVTGRITVVMVKVIAAVKPKNAKPD
jgi:hypothetical protein